MFCVVSENQQLIEASCENLNAWVVMTRTELAMYSPFYLDIESAVEISGALLLAMGVGFVLRMVRKSLEQHEEVG